MDLLHSFFFYKDGRFKTISSQMRQSKKIKSIFLFLSYCIARLATTGESPNEQLAAQSAGLLLALGIVFEENPYHAGFCATASFCFLALLYMKSYHSVLGVYTILLSVLLGLWLFCKRTEKRMPRVVEMYFGALEWVLTLMAIACGIKMGIDSEAGGVKTFIPFLE